MELEVGKVIKRGEDLFFFFLSFFFFFFFCFSLLKMTEICFGSTKIRILYWEKAFHVRKKSGKITLPPQKNMPVMPLFVPNYDRGPFLNDYRVCHVYIFQIICRLSLQE